MEEEIYENNYEDCDYCETTYYESDTGYCEYGCSFITGDENDYPCLGGKLDSGCPLSFKYKIEKSELQKVLKNKAFSDWNLTRNLSFIAL